MKQIDASMTPYAFFKLPFEEQLKQSHMNLLNDYAFYSHPMDKRKELLIAADPIYSLLESKLLAVGGNSVCYQSEPHLSEIVERGIQFGGKSRTFRGERSRCHGNVARLWNQFKDEGFEIVTGYALTEDGMWRQHSWGRMDGFTIETTVKRKKYFGVILTKDEAANFFIENEDMV